MGLDNRDPRPGEIARVGGHRRQPVLNEHVQSVFKPLEPFHFTDSFTGVPIQVHSTVMAMQRGSTTPQETLN